MGFGDILDQNLLGRLEGDSTLYSGQWLQGSNQWWFVINWWYSAERISITNPTSSLGLIWQ